MHPWTIAAGALALAGLGALAAERTLYVNGVESDLRAIEHDGRLYVPLDSLTAAGAETTTAENRVTVRFTPPPGMQPADLLPGVLGEWLDNGAWRIRVSDVSPIENPFGRGPGYQLVLELENLTEKPLVPFNSGLNALKLVDDLDQVLVLSNRSFADNFTSIPAGGGLRNTLQFGDSANRLTAIGKPTKLLVEFRATGGNQLKGFEINLDP